MDRKIGLFGGSFDPPHLGHVALVQAGLDIGLDEVWVIPALPVHRELSGHADGALRLNWLQRVFETQPKVKVLDWEISRQQPTPAIDSLRHFHRLYPDTTPWLMMGSDAWAGFQSWREYPAHQSLCNVAVFARRGVALATVCGHDGWQQLNLKDGLDCCGSGRWMYIPAELPDISATGLRVEAQRGKPLAGLAPEMVCRQIEQAYGKATEKM